MARRTLLGLLMVCGVIICSYPEAVLGVDFMAMPRFKIWADSMSSYGLTVILFALTFQKQKWVSYIEILWGAWLSIVGVWSMATQPWIIMTLSEWGLLLTGTSILFSISLCIFSIKELLDFPVAVIPIDTDVKIDEFGNVIEVNPRHESEKRLNG